jgi:transposase-like protein
LHKISYGSRLGRAQKALGKFGGRWGKRYPQAVKFLVTDEEQLLSFFQIKDSSFWGQIRMTNSIERRFREIRRRTRPMGVFSDCTSMERILFSVFTHEILTQATITPFLALTQNN